MIGLIIVVVAVIYLRWDYVVSERRAEDYLVRMREELDELLDQLESPTNIGGKK